MEFVPAGVNVRRLQFRREGGDDFLKARITAERVPKREQLQLAVAERSRHAGDDGQLFTGQVFFADPCRYDREKLDHVRAIYRILCDWKELDGAPSFP